MKIKRQKHNRKIVRFYTACFGFREPFKILCDGTFIHHLLANKITSSGHALSNILGGPTKLFTTRCVIAELKSLGSSYSESFEAARSLITARCDHEKRKSAAGCIEEVIGEDNSEHFFVATQDTDLRKKFQEVPGVPVVYGLRNSLLLDPPSESQRQCANEMEEKRLHASESEIRLLAKRGKSKLATEITADAPDMPEGSEDRVETTQPSTKRHSARTLGVVDKPTFKRKKPKGPNPLSCKKKKNHGNPSSASNQEGRNDGSASRKRNRKRKRSHKIIKAGETDG